MPLDPNYDPNMISGLAAIRGAFGSGQQAQQPDPEEERRKQAQLIALQRISQGNSPAIDQDKANMFVKNFMRR